jgi:secondary thiamine-phosphate synthase enzyme
MKQQTLTIQTTKLFDVKDLTDHVSEFLENISAKEGLVNIFTQHTTTAIKINEHEDGFLEDLKEVLFKDIAPHGCLNGHSHIAQMLIGSTSESIPVMNGKMQLGKWQRILFFEMDRPRERTVILSFLGF